LAIPFGYGTLKKTAIADAAEAKLKGSRWCDSEHSTNARLVR
jgi:hypothetical protein